MLFTLTCIECPEFRGKGTKTTLRWFMSWGDVAPIRDNIYIATGKQGLYIKALPFEVRSLVIQNTACGVRPQVKENV